MPSLPYDLLIILEHHMAKATQRARRRSTLFSAALWSALFCRSPGEAATAPDEPYRFSVLMRGSANALCWNTPARSRRREAPFGCRLL